MQNIGKNRVLITGGAGFLGSHLVDRYVDAGWDVICLDNFYTGHKANIAHHVGKTNFELVRHDVIDPCRFEVDLILNFACPASPPRYQKDPLQTFKTSVMGTMNLLELARYSGARLVQASTSEVYGDPQVHPQPESYWGHVNPIGIRSCYDEGKRAAETLILDYHRMYGVDYRIVRIFNTYGPRMDPEDGRVVSNFITQALAGKNLTMYGDGQQTRSFCYCQDLVDGIVALAHQNDTMGPVNLGNDGEFTMLELAQHVLEMTESKSQIVFEPLPQDDPKVRRPDLTAARGFLGYAPKFDLKKGLVPTIEYFRANGERRHVYGEG